MTTSGRPPANWAAIRPINGTSAQGFEALCVQLARLETPEEAQFTPKGAPDAGVECYATFPDGTEWGWQAKYFISALGNTQWNQLDSSVKTAIKNHSRLTKYYICVPRDLSDGRVVRKNGKRDKSEKDRWDERVKKWEDWAQNEGRTIEFFLWGEKKLWGELAQKPERSGLVYFWFNQRVFDQAWLSARLEEALQSAGPRYTPEVHVELPIAQDLDAFGRTPQFFNRIKALAIPIRDTLQRLSRSSTTEHLFRAIEAVLDAFSVIKHDPTEPLPFEEILKKIEEAEALREEIAKEHDKSVREEHNDALSQLNLFRKDLFFLGRLERELQNAKKKLRCAKERVQSRIFVLQSDAGMGKTHLLCDMARRRIHAQQPTILLMGQRFTTGDPPWIQLAQQLDLPGRSAEELIGALESAAQVRNERALIVIDGLNESIESGIWERHLAAFLAPLKKSPWLGVVLSMRSSYEKESLPEAARKEAVFVTHQGFDGHEYNAIQTFFSYYGLDLPPTPFVASELRQPFFLKMLCYGLRTQGQQRLLQGIYGISTVFKIYLEAVSQKLARSLGDDPKDRLALSAIKALARAMMQEGGHRLQRQHVRQAVDALLPGRSFERSLFRGLIAEGVLSEGTRMMPTPIEDSLFGEESTQDVVYISYERLADHLIAQAMVTQVPDPQGWASALSEGGALAAMMTEARMTSGLLEALFIQVVERTGQELLEFAPKLADHWASNDAFLKSLIWRSNQSLSEAAWALFNKIFQDNPGQVLETVLTVATVPKHPLNARFLDDWLRKNTMADRDAWWSTYLYYAWEDSEPGAVKRLVDWAWALGHDVPLDEEAIGLCGIAIGWMLTASHRFLRDRATKALVNLYTRRLRAAVRWVEHFVDVDDLYVKERVYAVAYGVVMRSRDVAAVGALAEAVYRNVFASGEPPAHILLRDYARGVVERAGSVITVDEALIRPPYKSEWPVIPSEEDIKPFLPDASEDAHGRQRMGAGQRAIGLSVMLCGDFARYVIGTNFLQESRKYLSLRRDEPAWTPTPIPVERLKTLEADCSEHEKPAWRAFNQAKRRHAALSPFVGWARANLQNCLDGKMPLKPKDGETLGLEEEDLPENFSPEEASEEVKRAIEAAKHKLEITERDLEAAEHDLMAAEGALEAVLSAEHVVLLREIQVASKDSSLAGSPPGFDLEQIQRYIFKRVFDLGWTAERFEFFDCIIANRDRDKASKPERIGKKYQWIAYHEMLAFLSDHFQYCDRSHRTKDLRYLGPWQDYLRDIDPSCTLRALPGGTSRDDHAPAWWGKTPYTAWDYGENLQEWIQRTTDLPKIEDLLLCTNSDDGSCWWIGHGHFSWREAASTDQYPFDVMRGEIWYTVNTYLIRTSDIAAFMEWAERVDFVGDWMPGPSELTEMFLGEYGWSPAADYFQNEYYGDMGWMQPESYDPEKGRCPVALCQIATEYHKEAGGFDCSIDEGYALLLPAEGLMTKLGLTWTGYGADFAAKSGEIWVQDPTAHAPGPSALLLRAEALQELQQREGLTLCWVVYGKKGISSANSEAPDPKPLHLSGVYVLEGTKLRGFMK